MFLLLGVVWPISADRPSAGARAEPGIRCNAVAGIGGYYRIGKCTPVTIHLENSGRSLDVRIQIRLSGELYTQAVSLPSPSRKKLVLHIVPDQDLHRLEIDLYSEGTLVKKLAPEMRRLSDEQILTVLSVSLEPYAPSNEDDAEKESREKKAFLDLAEFPEFWKEYDAADAVILGISDAGRLNSRQRTAMSQWTLLGGRVNLFDGDRGVPETRESSRNRPETDVSRSSSPRTAYGMGAFGPTGRSNGILATDEDAFAGYRSSIPALDREIFQADRIRNPFSRAYLLWYVAIFFLVYTAAAALWLKAFHEQDRMKSWKLAAVPVLALVFSFTSPWIGRIATAGAILVDQRSVIHVFAGNEDSFAVNDYILLLPRQAEYRLDSAFSSAHLVQTGSENEERSVTYEFIGPGAPSVRFEESLWGTRSIHQSYFSYKGLFGVQRGPDTITLSNRSDYSLEDCRLIRKGAVTPLDTIAAGERMQLVFPGDEDAAYSGSGVLLPPTGEGIFERAVAVYRSETNIGTMGDCVVCSLNKPIPGLASATADLSCSGSTAVVFHMGMQSGGGSD